MKRFISALGVVGLLGCAAGEPDGSVETEKVGQAEEPVNLLSGGFLPIPLDESGDQAWDGSLVDLMAADAFGFCAPYWRTEAEDFIPSPGNDDYLEHLLALMDAFPCGATTPFPGDPPWEQPSDTPSRATQWAAGRMNSQCNVDPITENRVAVTAPWQEDDDLANDNPLNRWAAYDVLTRLHPPTGEPAGGYLGAPWLAIDEDERLLRDQAIHEPGRWFEPGQSR